MVGISHRDVELALEDVVDRREAEALQENIQQQQQQKKTNKYIKAINSTKMEHLLNQEEVNALIEASNKPYGRPEDKPRKINYATYSKEEALELVNGTYDPNKFKKNG